VTAALALQPAVFIENELFASADLLDDGGPDRGHAVRLARRLLVVAWLIGGGVNGDDSKEAVLANARASSAFWSAHLFELRSCRPATLTTILFQLEALGLVEWDGFEKAEGGFHVKLREQTSA
jgi:hypothetical protein